MKPELFHWEVIGKDGPALQKFFGELFEWEFNTDFGTENEMNYGIVRTDDEDAVSGGVGGTPDGTSGHVTVYISVDDVTAYLKKAESLGGSIMMEETEVMEGTVIGFFGDPEGHMIGLMKAPQ